MSTRDDLDDYAHGAGHQLVPHAELHRLAYRECSCGHVADESLYSHTVPVGGLLWCREAGLPDEAVTVLLRLVMDEQVSWSLKDLELVLRQLTGP